MAIALVVSTSKIGLGASSAINTTGATLLVLFGGANNNPTPTDSKSNTWTALTTRIGSNAGSLCGWYCANPTVGSGHTFTWASGFGAFCVAAFSGVKTTSPKDQENGSATRSSGNTTGSVTPSESNELVVAGLGGGLDTGKSIDSGFTIANSVDAVGGVNYSAALAYLIQTSAAAVNPAWTFSVGSPGANNVTFKAAAAAGNRRRRVLLGAA